MLPKKLIIIYPEIPGIGYTVDCCWGKQANCTWLVNITGDARTKQAMSPRAVVLSNPLNYE